MDLTITVTQDDLSPAIRRLISAIDPARLMQVAGKRLEIEMRKHFLDLDRRPNKRGWPSRHFWSRISKSTALGAVSRDSATVSVSDPAFWAKKQGATIRPKRGKFLAIPATAAAYAAGSPREGGAPELSFDRQVNPATGRMQFCLSVKSSNTASTVWYWLARQTTVPADPDALPREIHLKAAILDSIESFVARNSGVPA
jgi:hypothetical protein